jgi:hypothetical protein
MGPSNGAAFSAPRLFFKHLSLIYCCASSCQGLLNHLIRGPYQED